MLGAVNSSCIARFIYLDKGLAVQRLPLLPPTKTQITDHCWLTNVKGYNYGLLFHFT